MHNTLRRLQAEVDARKRPRWWIGVLAGRVGTPLIWALLGFYAGARASGAAAAWVTDPQLRHHLWRVGEQLDGKEGEIALQRAQLERLERVQRNSARYRIPADLAAAIDDIARSENLDPSLAFELVRVESEFKARAVSPVGAIGYTQLMPATARWLQPGVRSEQLYDRETNLRLGFRFMRVLIDKYDGNIRLALHAYNRGPALVDRLVAEGRDPSNGYANLVLKGRR